MNNQIILNKRCYAELYTRLLIGDIERERTQLLAIEARFDERKSHVFNEQIRQIEYENVQLFFLFNSLHFF